MLAEPEAHLKSDRLPAPPTQWSTRPIYMQADHWFDDGGDYSISATVKPLHRPDGVRADRG